MGNNVDSLEVQDFADFLKSNNAPYEIFYMTGRELFTKGLLYTIHEQAVSYSYLPNTRIFTDIAKFLAKQKTKNPIGVHSIILKHDEDTVYLNFAIAEKQK